MISLQRISTRTAAILVGLLLAVLGASIFWSRQPGRSVTLILATGVPDSGFNALGNQIRIAVNDADPSIKIEVRATDGSDDNMKLLNDGDADLAIVQNDTDPNFVDVHTLIPLHRSVFHFLVRRDASVQSIYDLRDKRVGVGQKLSGNFHVVTKLLEHFGIGLEELQAVNESFTDSQEKLRSGELDAVLVMTAINSNALKKFVQAVDVRYVSLAKSHAPGNEVDGFAVTYPYVERFTIPQFVYPLDQDPPGIPVAPCETFALRSSLVSRGDLPDDIARTIVAAIVSHRTSMMREGLIAQDITEHFEPEDLQFPIHHGAMAYFQRQRPGFLERYSEPMAFILSLFLALCGFVAAFNKWVVVRKKNRIDRYYSRLDELLTELNTQTLTADRLNSIEHELLGVRHDAVRELVEEQLLADDSFQIFQSLLTDCHQQLSLLRRFPTKSEP